MMILMNSAMMPRDGTFRRKTITALEFKQIFLRWKDNYRSHIGYPNACKVLSEFTGVQIPLSRDITIVKKGDFLLVARLTYRVDVDEKATRKHGGNISDYEFCYVTYEEDEPCPTCESSILNPETK